MTDEPNSFSTLRKFYKTRREVDIEQVWDEYDKESDRACVILASAGLEDTLALMLMRKMRKVNSIDEFDPLFEGPSAPLSSFSGKITLGYFLGVIDERVQTQLSAIRHMRNACAHSQHAISFANSELSNVCVRIFAPNGLLRVPNLNDPTEIRRAFITETAALDNVMLVGREGTVEWLRSLDTRPQP